MPDARSFTTDAASQAAICAALDAVGLGAATLSPDGTWLEISPRFCRLIGRSAEEIRDTPLGDLLLVDRAGVASGAVAASVADSRLETEDGQVLSVRSALSAIREQPTAEAAWLLLVLDDRTSGTPRGQERSTAVSGPLATESAGRLIDALEEERARIARELHDDIAQSLAVLVIQMLRAGKPVSGAPGRTHRDVPELAAKVQDIASRVSRLSHELHSSRLEYLGVEKAVRAACREFSEAHRLPVDCACEAMPDSVDGRVGLCVLRVVQEALHNVAKHSRATHVQVRLNAESRGLRLSISDDGIGFDVLEASLAEGIGLISMRERVSFLGGRFNLSSAPGRGTRIDARIPLSPDVR